MEHSTLRNPDSSDDWAPRRVRIPVRPEAVVRARDTVRRSAARAGISQDRTDDLVVAVSEACTNAMESQLRAGVTAPIVVTCSLAKRVFEVQVRDHGAGFEPAALPPRPPLDDPGHLDIERGWGIELMRQLVDELVFDVTGNGMCVRLRMHL
jgi:serine/threonine-protein kinase RsbW